MEFNFILVYFTLVYGAVGWIYGWYLNGVYDPSFNHREVFTGAVLWPFGLIVTLLKGLIVFPKIWRRS